MEQNKSLTESQDTQALYPGFPEFNQDGTPSLQRQALIEVLIPIPLTKT